MPNDNKDLQDLRSAFNKFETALALWIEKETVDSYNAARKSFQRIVDDYVYIQEEYEGLREAKIAENIATTYTYNIMLNLPEDVFPAFMDVIIRSDDGISILGKFFFKALHRMPGDKHVEKEKWLEYFFAET